VEGHEKFFGRFTPNVCPSTFKFVQALLNDQLFAANFHIDIFSRPTELMLTCVSSNSQLAEHCRTITL